MSKRLPDYPVMIPYSDLCELLEASKKVKEFEAQVKRYEAQVVALRIIQLECIDKIKELEKLL